GNTLRQLTVNLARSKNSSPPSQGGSMTCFATALLVTCLVAATPAAADDPVVVPLWPGKPPDETADIGPETVRMSPKLERKQVEVTEPTKLITNVTKPTLTIYRPAKDKDTGTAVIICPGGGYWNLYWQLDGAEV